MATNVRSNLNLSRAQQGGLLLVALGASIWGTDTIIRGPLSQTFSSLEVVTGEHLILALFAIPAVVFGWQQIRSLNVGQWGALLVIGVGGSALATILFTYGISQAFALLYTPGQAAAGGNALNTVFLMQQTQPFFAVLAAAIFLRERLTIWYLPFFLAGIIGAYLVAFGATNNSGSTFFSPFGSIGQSPLLYISLGLGAALLWGTSTAMGRLLSDKLSFPTLTGARFFIGLLFLLGAMLVARNSLPDFVGAIITNTNGSGLRLALLALFPGLIGLLLYYAGLRSTRASYATLAELAYPFVGVVLNWLILGAKLAPLQFVGGVLIIGTIVAMNWMRAGVIVAPPRVKVRETVSTT